MAARVPPPPPRSQLGWNKECVFVMCGCVCVRGHDWQDLPVCGHHLRDLGFFPGPDPCPDSAETRSVSSWCVGERHDWQDLPVCVHWNLLFLALGFYHDHDPSAETESVSSWCVVVSGREAWLARFTCLRPPPPLSRSWLRSRSRSMSRLGWNKECVFVMCGREAWLARFTCLRPPPPLSRSWLRSRSRSMSRLGWNKECVFVMCGCVCVREAWLARFTCLRPPPPLSRSWLRSRSRSMSRLGWNKVCVFVMCGREGMTGKIYLSAATASAISISIWVPTRLKQMVLREWTRLWCTFVKCVSLKCELICYCVSGSAGKIDV